LWWSDRFSLRYLLAQCSHQAGGWVPLQWYQRLVALNAAAHLPSSFVLANSDGVDPAGYHQFFVIHLTISKVMRSHSSRHWCIERLGHIPHLRTVG